MKTYQQLKKELFDWFKISRGPTLQKISQDDLFESAVLFFRNSRIQNPEAKIERDRTLLDQIIDDINSNRYFQQSKQNNSNQGSQFFIWTKSVPRALLQIKV